MTFLNTIYGIDRCSYVRDYDAQKLKILNALSRFIMERPQ
jgi:hypothetical protein